MIKTLRRINPVRRVVKKLRIYKEFMIDAHLFSKYYMESAMKHGDFNYRIILIVHSIEKGFCMNNPKPFGETKITELIHILESNVVIGEYEHELGASTVNNWVDFWNKHNWEKTDAFRKAEDYASGYKNYHKSSTITFCKPTVNLDSSFREVLETRHTARDYTDRRLAKKDLEQALRFFVSSPSACNRQMCKVYYIENEQFKQILISKIMGIRGINKETVNLFLITYVISAFDFSGERNQGMLNAGLASMNFVNALHASGIGSCFFQWANKESDEKMIKKQFGIPENERFAIVIGAGYYKDKNLSPSSIRREESEVLTVL